jgi:hypothetical protein
MFHQLLAKDEVSLIFSSTKVTKVSNILLYYSIKFTSTVSKYPLWYFFLCRFKLFGYLNAEEQSSQ